MIIQKYFPTISSPYKMKQMDYFRKWIIMGDCHNNTINARIQIQFDNFVPVPGMSSFYNYFFTQTIKSEDHIMIRQVAAT